MNELFAVWKYVLTEAQGVLIRFYIGKVNKPHKRKLPADPNATDDDDECLIVRSQFARQNKWIILYRQCYFV